MIGRRSGLALLALTLLTGPACRRSAPPVSVPDAGAPAALVLAAVSGQITRAGAGAALAAGTGLRAGDVIVAGPDGSAVVRLPDGRSVQVSAGSRVRVDSADAGQVVLAIENGVVVSRVPAEGSGTVRLDILTPLGIVRVPAGAGESTITVAAGAITVAVAVGEIDFIDREGHATRARASERLEVDLGGIELISVGGRNVAAVAEERPPADPATLQPGEIRALAPARLRARRGGGEVVLPTTRGLRVHADALSAIDLTWSPELADAVVEVAEDARFAQPILVARPPGAKLRLPGAPRRGQLHWRVTGTVGGARRTLVGHARFLPDRARSLLDLAHPHNRVAETGKVTTVYFQSVLPALTLAWNARKGAAAYQVQVFRAQDLTRPVHDQRIEGQSGALPAGALGEGSYRWHAIALDAEGRALGGGLMNKLEIVYDNPLNTLAIGSPKPGAVVGDAVDVVGAAPLGSRLFVNGQAVALDAKGRFELRIGKRPSSVVFRLVAHDGSESYWVRQLRTRS